MSPIPFNDREMINAWKENFKASQAITKSNSHRLLLFYAVECGLKAILMKRQSLTCTEECEDISRAQHNINYLLSCLRAGEDLRIKRNFLIKEIIIYGRKHERRVPADKINQAWRYGGKFICEGESNGETDLSVEKSLLKIHKWIEQELK